MRYTKIKKTGKRCVYWGVGGWQKKIYNSATPPKNCGEKVVALSVLSPYNYIKKTVKLVIVKYMNHMANKVFMNE